MSSSTEIQGGGRALTPQREVVLQVVRASAEHLTAAGLVRESRFGNGGSRYDRETERHDHALCTRCGKLLDFDLAETVQLMQLAARRSRFQPESIHLTLLGVCPDCAAAPKRSVRRAGRRKG